MYSYMHDPETGGLLLIDTPGAYSKEPRPVYAQEMDLLGFNQYWKYDAKSEEPYMWAEANYYWYRGKRVARINGGNAYKQPVLTLEKDEKENLILQKDTCLERVDLLKMVEKNLELLDVLQKKAEKRIIHYYEKCRKKIDCFYVAFSGGKDSLVLLDLVKRTLPADGFIVLFGDTGMEFPDTYRLVEQVERDCKEQKIAFYQAKSHLNPEESWKLFGPPSKTLRWCCSVHKSTPQILKLREISNKKDCVGLAFVGVREHESLARSKYKVFNYGKKQKGQYSLNPVLEWSSAEVWLYIYWQKLYINEAYKKGNSRVGCLCCPSAAEGSSAWFRRLNYSKEYDNYISYVRSSLSNELNKEKYIKESVWTIRYSGRDLSIITKKHTEKIIGDIYSLIILTQDNNFNEWLKTLPLIPFNYNIISDKNHITITFQKKYIKSHYAKIIREAALKSAYCIQCRTCEANCPTGNLSFSYSKFTISNCSSCLSCYSIDNACLLYRSTRIPKDEKMKEKNINIFEDYNFTDSWFINFFREKQQFIENNSLGPNQFKIFKRILKYGEFLDKKNKITPFFNKFLSLDPTSSLSWNLFFINSAFNNIQINWYIKNMPVNQEINVNDFKNKLSNFQVPDKSQNKIIAAFIKICNLQFAKIINFGSYRISGSDIFYKRSKPIPPDPRVFLYGLYKFAEALDGYYEIPLGRLMDFEKESKGISPSEIFGLSREETAQYLGGLAFNYPDFVPSFTSTLGLELLYLNPDRTSSDVLELF